MAAEVDAIRLLAHRVISLDAKNHPCHRQKARLLSAPNYCRQAAIPHRALPITLGLCGCAVVKGEQF
jgi:hypothetical protein